MAGEWTLSAWDVAAGEPRRHRGEVVDAVEDWTPNGEEPYGKAYFPLSLGLLLPVIGAGLAFRAVSKRSPAKVVNRAMYVTLFGTLLNAQLLFIFLPTVVGVGIAAFQVRKAEVRPAARPPPRRRGRRATSATSTRSRSTIDEVDRRVEEAIDAEDEPIESRATAESTAPRSSAPTDASSRLRHDQRSV